MTAVFAGGCAAQDTAATTQTSEPVTGTEIILTIGQPDMLVNGAEQAIDENGTVPMIINDRILLPVRAVVEAMGGTAEWNGGSQTVTLTKNSDVISLVIASEEAYFNDTPYTLDTPPVIINDRTMLPIRFIAESFGFEVEWGRIRAACDQYGAFRKRSAAGNRGPHSGSGTIPDRGYPGRDGILYRYYHRYCRRQGLFGNA